MTVEELIEELQQCDPKLEIKFAYNYGDHWRTQVTSNISSVDEGYTKYSDYHQMDKMIDDEDDDGDLSIIIS
jgi:hypothetical protein